MISNSGTTSLGLYDFKRQIDAFGGVDYFRPSLAGGYLPNARVMLTNGEIVQNKTSGNLTNNPNTDMTGWVNDNSASQIKYENGDSVQDVKDRSVYIQDFGGAYNDFDPSVAEAEAKAIANQNSKPYDGARQFAFPMRTLKAWNYCDGFKDRGAVASFQNVGAFNSPEPRTEILGIDNAAGLGGYKDRDVAGLFVQVNGQPALHTSTATVFTATTVTCADMPSRVKGFLRKNQIIDVVDGGMTYSGLIQSVLGDTITVDTAWYKTDDSKTTGTPSSGSQIKIVPNTKIWATNFNVMLKPNSDAKSMVGIELGVFNNKYSNHTGYGYDIWSGGTFPINQAFQARGKYYSGLHLQGEYQFGVISEACNRISFYDKGSQVGFLSQGSADGIVLKDTKNVALNVQDVTGKSLTAISPAGAWQSLKYELSVINTPSTIDKTSVVIFVNPNTDGMVVNLPTPSDNARRTIFVKNLSATNTVFLAGVVENGGGSYHLKTKETVQMICDNVTWFPISRHQM